MQTLRLPELTDGQIEELSLIAEEAARTYVYSKIPAKRILRLDIITETEGSKPTTLSISIELVMSPSKQKIALQKIVDEASREAFSFAEKYLGQVSCHSMK